MINNLKINNNRLYKLKIIKIDNYVMGIKIVKKSRKEKNHIKNTLFKRDLVEKLLLNQEF